MSYNQIMLCMEQKKVLLTNILNVTKQMEVRCKQPDIRLDDLLNKRGVFIQRLNKCNVMIQRLLGELPKEQQERMRRFMEGKLESGKCAEEEQKFRELSTDCRVLVEKAAALDAKARKKLLEQYAEVKEQIKNSRIQDGNMFYSG